MTMRQNRHRIVARQLRRAQQIAALNGSRDEWLHDDDDEWDDEPECMRCHGDGRDPLTDYLMPCPECGDWD